MRDELIRFGRVAGLILALFVVLTVTGWSDEPVQGTEPRRVTVTGEAEVRVVPDEVILTLGIETWDKNLQAAKGQNDRILANVLEVAADHGIRPEHLQTDFVSIEPRYRNGYYEERDFIGFFVHRNVVITLRDLGEFEGLLSNALEAGVNYVHGIQFRTTELRQHRDQARALAIQAAKEKAEALAGKLDQQVGEPLDIQEVQNGWWSGYNAWWGARYGGGMTQNVIQEAGDAMTFSDGGVAPGQIAVSARVSVVFGLSR